MGEEERREEKIPLRRLEGIRGRVAKVVTYAHTQVLVHTAIQMTFHNITPDRSSIYLDNTQSNNTSKPLTPLTAPFFPLASRQRPDTHQ